MEKNSFPQKSLEYKVLQYIKNNHLIPPGSRVLTAVSGGADSVCLLLILKKLEQVLNMHVEAVTVDHGIRGEASAADSRFVWELCKEKDVPVTVHHMNVPERKQQEGGSEEEVARKVRYECFFNTARESEIKIVAVAHHQNDNSETILHNLFRGSGLKGLGGMAPMRDVNGIHIIRPLLDIGRDEIESWLLKKQISWRTDETNLEDTYTRNRIRHQILPMIENTVNKNAGVHISQAGDYIRQAQELIEELAQQELKGRISWIDTQEAFGEISKILKFNMAGLENLKPIIRREVLVQACRTFLNGKMLKDITNYHIQQLEKLIQGQTSKKVYLPGNIQIKKQYDYLIFQNKIQDRMQRQKPPKSYRCDSALEQTQNVQNYSGREEIILMLADGNHINVADPQMSKGISFRLFSYQGEKIPKNNYTKWFDYGKIKTGLTLRTRRSGDYFVLENGGRKTVKRYLIEQKIPQELRDDILLLTEGSHVLWLSDNRISAAYKVSRETQMVLELFIHERGELS